MKKWLVVPILGLSIMTYALTFANEPIRIVDAINLEETLHITGKVYKDTTFERTFGFHPSSGNNLNIQVDNYQTPIYLAIYKDGRQVYGKTIEKDETVTYKRETTSSATYKVKADTKDGAEFSTFIKVRQW